MSTVLALRDQALSCVRLLDSPLAQHHLTVMRNRETKTNEFRFHYLKLSTLLAAHVGEGLVGAYMPIDTPLTSISSLVLNTRTVLVPVETAAGPMGHVFRDALPNVDACYSVCCYRDENNGSKTVEVYHKLPESFSPNEMVLVLDPMLATGGTLCHTISLVKQRGAKLIRYVGMIGAPEGVIKVYNEHPDVPIFLAALDEGLDHRNYIVPGLGDAGDRVHGR